MLLINKTYNQSWFLRMACTLLPLRITFSQHCILMLPVMSSPWDFTQLLVCVAAVIRLNLFPDHRLVLGHWTWINNPFLHKKLKVNCNWWRLSIFYLFYSHNFHCHVFNSSSGTEVLFQSTCTLLEYCHFMLLLYIYFKVLVTTYFSDLDYKYTI